MSLVQSRVPRPIVLVVLASLLAAALVPLPPVSASATVAVMDAVLPTPRDGTSAVRAGAYLYIFGGDDGSSRKNDILRYHPATDTLVKMGATLPSGRSGTSAVYDGTHIYVFGGWTPSGYSDQIVRYNPTTDTVSVMSGKLPSARYFTSAVWSGSAAYIIGGGVTCSPCTTNQIVRYVPSTDTVTITNATLPSNRYGTSAVWAGGFAYIFGGVTASTSTEHADIIRYNPTTGQVTLLSSSLPTPRYHTSATWHTGRAYVFGGYGCSGFPGYCKQVVEFDPASGSVGVLSVQLPTGRYLTSAAANNTHAFVFGGYDGMPRTNQTVRFGPPVLPPPPNTPPTIDPIGSLAIGVDLELNVSVSAHDADNDPLTLSLTPTPANGTFTDHGDGTGTFLWLTNETDLGTHTFTVTAHDGEDSATRTFDVTVTGNPPPVFDPIPATTAAENSHLVLFITASDPENEPLVLTMPVVPAHATFTDGGNGVGTLDWFISYEQAGVYDLTVFADDNTTNVSTTFRVTITNVDRKPIFAPTAPGTAIEGQPFQIPVSATDPDNEAIVLTAAGLPSGSTFTDNGGGTGQFAWTPPSGSVGPYSILVTASAGPGTTSMSLSFNVVKAVDFRLIPIGPSFVLGSPGQTLNLQMRVSNVGGTADTYTFTATDVGVEPGWIVQAPSTVSLAAGASTVVTVKVTVPPDGVVGKPRVFGHSSAAPLTRLLNWQVDVPVYLTLEMDNDQPMVSDLSLLNGVTGTVTAKWHNGQPALGVGIDVTQTPDNRPALSSTESGSTDATGVFAFDFGADVGSIFPGDHAIVAKAVRPPRTDQASGTYSVRVVGVV